MLSNPFRYKHGYALVPGGCPDGELQLPVLLEGRRLGLNIARDRSELQRGIARQASLGIG
jgi:hypothetical protein